MRRILDVKCPGSGEAGHNRWENLADLRPTDEVKFVLADRADYELGPAGDRGARARRALPDPLLAGARPRSALAELAGWILADRLPVRLADQLHKRIWGPDARGV